MSLFIETRSLTKRYGRFTALSDCGLEVRPGEVFGLLGPNGAGKTTLLRLLLGFLRPTSGTATIDGLDCYRRSVEVHQRVSYLPGDARLFRKMRGANILQFFAGVRAEGSLQRAQTLAQRLDLDLSRRVASMSTGMRQKLALAVTLSADVPLIILDEPTSSLDPSVRAVVSAMVREAKNEGRTVLFSSHVLSEVEEVCDRVTILRDGQIVHTQVMSELHRHHRIRAQLTGPMPSTTDNVPAGLSIQETKSQGEILIDASGELAGVFGYLATLPLAEVQVEPIGLREVYEHYHVAEKEEA